MAYPAPHTSRFSASAPLPTTPLARGDSARNPHPASLQQQLFGPSPAGANAPRNIIDRPLAKTKGAEVAMGAWAFLFAEIVAYSQSRVDSVSDLEARLSSLGYDAGQRILPLLLLRNIHASGIKEPKREHRLIPILQFIHTQVYRYCFGKAADGLERSVEEENEYMITLNQPPLTQFISVPKDMSQLSCEAFTAGIVEGVLDGLQVPARVTAHTVPTDAFPQRTVILIKLDQKVMDREEALGK
ncbi:BET3 family protein [Cryptococcus gattii E566]|uniref:Trafficking protein particle complex subunit n=2 Tax=Cryptococcus gattii TaxID=37769 RepID=E6R128_CRYGW|nr:ER to Golgi transport-related protein, putative [Cryptococcus gattii WM276]ADV20488.1 ER to Golgi transport-related protein, putative [Cryptococcus gattii WM276]KIR76907.1 BET3 family protein [Cryptococcus gattii EJB2]KIY31357.1 BET3 family protein [Cryptococcus gattii E566]KJD99475.1 BET3 family protein [Cryptococcus gattii NT-10]